MALRINRNPAVPSYMTSHEMVERGAESGLRIIVPFDFHIGLGPAPVPEGTVLSEERFIRDVRCGGEHRGTLRRREIPARRYRAELFDDGGLPRRKTDGAASSHEPS
jgi:hypothetical protein